MYIIALYLACSGKQGVRLIGMSCTSWLCILPVSAKKKEKKSQTFFGMPHAIIALYLACSGKQGVRLIGMLCTSWLCILPVCAKKVSDLLECHVHHGSVSLLGREKKGSDFLECHVQNGSVSCLFGQKKCQTYWNLMYIMARLN